MTQTAAATPSVVREAIAFYDQLLKDAKLTQADYDAFQQAVIDSGNTFGGRSSCPYLRPQFVSAAQWAKVQEVSRLVNQAMSKAGEIIQSDATIRELLCLTDMEKILVEPDPGYASLSPTCRYDSFMSEAGFAYVELNAECPAGPAFTTVLAQTFLEQPIMKQFQERFDVTMFDVRKPLLDMLTTVYAEWRANGHESHPGKPRIAVVDYLDVPTVKEFYLCRDYFREHGFEAVVADPLELRYEGGKLLDKDGSPIDLVYRRLLTNEFLDRFDELQAFWNAYKDGAACFVNSFRSKFLHKKMIFGILTDERVMAHFTEAEKEAVRFAVPWTRLVRAGETTDAAGKPIDLLPWIKANQQNLVLKPNDDYGGKGVYIGWASTEAEWDQAIAEAQTAPYVTQWKVNAPQVDFPVWDTANGQLAFEPQTIDIDPYMFFGEAYGFLTRLSSTPLCNVTAGGGIVPTYVVAPKA